MGTYGPVHRVSVTLGGMGKECKDVAMATLKCKYTCVSTGIIVHVTIKMYMYIV